MPIIKLSSTGSSLSARLTRGLWRPFSAAPTPAARRTLTPTSICISSRTDEAYESFLANKAIFIRQQLGEPLFLENWGRHTAISLSWPMASKGNCGLAKQAAFKKLLAPLQTTFCPLELGAIRQAGQTLLHFYREAATALAETHDIPYPAGLERVMVAHFEK
ncbi:MAG: hypothetical protein R2911_17960 [Caldilineaceae bacterium]